MVTVVVVVEDVVVVDVAVVEVVSVVVGTVVVSGSGPEVVERIMQILQPCLTTVLSLDQEMSPVGTTLSGPLPPLYRTPFTLRKSYFFSVWNDTTLMGPA